MNELISTMALDMNIKPFYNETIESYEYRVIYSALGQWCIKSACAPEGITKHAQTSLVNELIKKYTIIFPEVSDMFVQDEQITMPVFIRRIFEETGYLITDQNNRNKIAPYGRGIQAGSSKILFGLGESASINGLGVFSDDIDYTVSWKEVFFRDELSCEEYVSAIFDVILFSKRDVSLEKLQYFNPTTNDAPSSSWKNTMVTDKTIARDLSNGVYYKVMRYNEELLFCDCPPNAGVDSLTGFEYRRIYYALKKHFNYPLKAYLKKLDDTYSKISIGGHLPNREYFIMLLCSWPYQNYANKREFIIKNEYIGFANEILENIGIEIVGG